jgi:ATP-dependent protease ClpP protease subunit
MKISKRIDVKGQIVNSSNSMVYDWLGIENTSPQKIVKALAEAGGEDIEVYINSPGGDVFAGSEIYTELRSYGGKKLIRITGIAASAASVIAQAGECEISPTGMFMIHNVQTRAAGDYRVMDNTGDALRAANQAIMNAYVEKTHRDPEELQALMDRDTYLSAQQAVEYGFVDRMMFQDSDAIPMQNGFGEIPEDTIEKIRNLIKNHNVNESGNGETRKYAAARLKFLNLKGEKNYDKSRV